MNRRSLIQILIGVIATLASLGSLMVVRQNRCVAAGGQWSVAERTCAGPNGPIAVAQPADFAVAIAVGALLAFMLYRLSTFATRRASGR